MLSFLGDAIVALLLIATIGYSFILNRRLGTVRNDREKFEVLVRTLNAASQRAETAVTGLRVTADELSRRLEKKVEEARALSDDLSYMIERGGSIADKLANQIRAGRDELKPDYRPEQRSTQRPQSDEYNIEPAPRPTPPRTEPSRAEAPRPAYIRTEARGDAIRVEPRVAVAAAAPPRAAPAIERPTSPSRAERDLLRALAARRR
ncbi:MAG TPA: DUF6468 domain-containing protein [Stellaceae bacterium]